MQLLNMFFSLLDSKFFFDPMNFVKNLSYMGKGMLVIFVIIGVIIIATLLINKIFSAKKKDDK